MKAPSITATNRFTGIQWFTMVVGVVIAISCSLVLLSDLNPRHHERKRPVFRNESSSVIISKIARVSEINLKTVLAKF